MSNTKATAFFQRYLFKFSNGRKYAFTLSRSSLGLFTINQSSNSIKLCVSMTYIRQEQESDQKTFHISFSSLVPTNPPLPSIQTLTNLFSFIKEWNGKLLTVAVYIRFCLSWFQTLTPIFFSYLPSFACHERLEVVNVDHGWPPGDCLLCFIWLKQPTYYACHCQVKPGKQNYER